MKSGSLASFPTRKTKFEFTICYRFLVNMHYAFEDRDNLYLVIDLMSGGDLRFHIGKYRRFTEEQTSKLRPNQTFRVFCGLYVALFGIST